MTTIAFDGKTLAADRQGDRSGLRCAITKIWRLPNNGEVLAVCGSASHAQTLKRWYIAGAVPDQYPKFQADNETSSTLIVLTAHGALAAYASEPYPITEEPRENGRLFTAWGSGRDFAIAAMALGKSAVEAVQLASRLDVSTGLGVDFFSLDGSSGQVLNP